MIKKQKKARNIEHILNPAESCLVRQLKSCKKALCECPFRVVISVIWNNVMCNKSKMDQREFEIWYNNHLPNFDINFNGKSGAMEVIIYDSSNIMTFDLQFYLQISLFYI